MKAEVVFAWIIIAFIGVILYSAPVYILKLVKEGFNTIVGDKNIHGTLSPEQIDVLRKMLGTPGFNDSSKGVKAQPEGVFGSTDSKSSHADVQNVQCLSSGQGVAYRKMTNPGAPSSDNLKTQTDYVPPPIPINSPNCPDLKDYIRKDKIPCWGCKL